VKKMKKKGKVTVGALLIVALLASMAFVSAVSSSEDAPEEISEEIYASAQVVAIDQDIAYSVDSNATTEEGTRADYNIDGGWLRIDEGAGNVCTGNAQGWQLVDVQAGDTCKITVDYRYIDTGDITGGYAIFRLTAPDSGVDEDRIADRWGFDDSCTGELERTFTVYPNQHYTFEIYCERGDDSFTDSASIYT
jgi:hypothetical protein